jgi:hypothetical protein
MRRMTEFWPSQLRRKRPARAGEDLAAEKAYNRRGGVVGPA